MLINHGKIKSRLFLLTIACLMTSYSWPQQRTITGKVIDDSNETLPGVCVYIKGNRTEFEK